MAGRAIAFFRILEQVEAAHFLLAQLRFSGQVIVVFTVIWMETAILFLVLRERKVCLAQRQVGRRKYARAEQKLHLRRVRRGLELGQKLAHILVCHFVWSKQRPSGLVGKIQGAAVQSKPPCGTASVAASADKVALATGAACAALSCACAARCRNFIVFIDCRVCAD